MVKFLPILVGLLAFTAIFGSIEAFADEWVSVPAGTGVAGCEQTNECYIPYEVVINDGEEVTWSNDDTVPHTVTSGLTEGHYMSGDFGPDGLFDSSLFMAGNTFSVKFDNFEPGKYPYYCMVHPWMIGFVIVESGDGIPSPTPDPTPEDNIPPKILKPNDIVVEAENANGAKVTYEVLVIDDTDKIVRPSCSPSSGSFFAVGDTRVTCNAMDSAGNRANPISFTVTVNSTGILIPNWVKNVAVFWCEDKIPDSEFVGGIQYLIDNDIIIVSATSSEYDSSQNVPVWIKNNACWWSQNLISDEDFAGGIEYLINEGILRV